METENGRKHIADLVSINEETMAHHDRMIDLNTVAGLLGICSRTVHRLVAAGVLPPPAKIGRSSRWFMTDIDTYMDKLRTTRDRKVL